MAARVAVIIPARWGSTRFPGKALHPILGQPLVQRVWERASQAQGIARVIIATDDQRIADAARAFGAEVAMTSPTHPSGTDRLAEVAATLPEFTHFINVQGDEPAISPALISELAASLEADPALEMITAADVINHEPDVANPNVVKVVCNAVGEALYFSRSPLPYFRGDFRMPQLRHQGIYGYARDFLLQFVSWPPGRLEQAEQLEQLRALEHGTRIRVLVTEHRSVGVDTPADVATAERLLR